MNCKMEPNLYGHPGDSTVRLGFWNVPVGANLNVVLADKIVKVPEMAESISEGTLKQWSKS